MARRPQADFALAPPRILRIPAIVRAIRVRPQWEPRSAGMRGGFSVSAGAFVLAGVIVAALPVAAQVYPSKQIELIVPFVAGGTTDNIARMMAQRFTESWSQPVIVNNRPGGGGVIGTAAVAKAPP